MVVSWFRSVCGHERGGVLGKRDRPAWIRRRYRDGGDPRCVWIVKRAARALGLRSNRLVISKPAGQLRGVQANQCDSGGVSLIID